MVDWKVALFDLIHQKDGSLKYKYNEALLLEAFYTWITELEDLGGLGLDVKTIQETDQILIRFNGAFKDSEWPWLRSQITNRLQGLQRYTPTRLNKIQDLLIARTNDVHAIDFDANPDLLCYENGVFDYEKDRLRPHKAKDLFLVKIPHGYGDVGDGTVFETFLQQVVPPEYHEFIWIWVGYVISPHRNQGMALIMKGTQKGNNGKNTFASVIASILGEKMVTNVPLKRVLKQYGGAALIGKKLCISSEIDQYDLNESGSLKTIVTEPTIWAEKKGEDGADFHNHCKIMIGMNLFPKIRPNIDLAFLKRFGIVPFPYEYLGREDNPVLLKELVQPEVLGAIIYKATRIYQSFRIKYKKFHTYFLEKLKIDVIEENRSRWLGEVYPLSQFVDDCCVVDERVSIPRPEFREAFELWCKEKAIPFDKLYYTMTRITQLLKKLHGIKSATVYTGIDLTSNQELKQLELDLR